MAVYQPSPKTTRRARKAPVSVGRLRRNGKGADDQGVLTVEPADVDLPTPSNGSSALDDAFDALEPKEKYEIYTQIGKDLARSVGANVVAQMLAASGLSGRELEKLYGFDHTALSRLARGDAKSGPTLWKIFALSHALGFHIELSASKKE